MHVMTNQTCARSGCENTGPLTDIAGGMMPSAEPTEELPEGDVAEPVFVCEACEEEYSERVNQEGGLSPAEFIADEVNRADE